MATIKPTPPALFLAAVFSSDTGAIEWARGCIEANWGAIALTSQPFEHDETGYYADEMGQPIVKQFIVVAELFDPASLADRKVQSNDWEQQLSSSGQFSVARPVNIDPGYLMLGKLILASTKDRAHRIYLRDGIYAEECLYYVGGWQSRPWTYPDYQRADYQKFFSEVRELLKQIIANTR
ncbi:MAG: DUF4416 family protein [Pirellulales bacterium]